MTPEERLKKLRKEWDELNQNHNKSISRYNQPPLSSKEIEGHVMQKEMLDKVVQNWFFGDFSVYLMTAPGPNPNGVFWVLIYKDHRMVYREDISGSAEHEAVVRARNIFGLLLAPEEGAKRPQKAPPQTGE